MAIAKYSINQISYPVRQIIPELPIFQTAEQFIHDCQLLLASGVSPNQILNGNTSTIKLKKYSIVSIQGLT